MVVRISTRNVPANAWLGVAVVWADSFPEPTLDVPVGRADHELERRGVASRTLHLVVPLAADSDDAAPESDVRSEGGMGRERLEQPLDELAAGREIVLVRRCPAGGLEEPACRGVDEVAPRRKQPHVPPLADARPHRVARLEHDRRLALLDEMRGGSKSDRPRADDRDR